MSPARSIRLSIAALLVVAACTEEPTTAVVLEGPESPTDLELSLPALDPGRLVAQHLREAAATPNPARVLREYDEGDEPPEDPALYANRVGTIYNAKTFVGFGPGYAYSLGQHSYQGNKGRVETTATVWYDGRTLGAQTAATEDYGIFLFDGGRVKPISAMARVYSDYECELGVSGASDHYAWWEWFLGGGAASWGKAQRGSDAPLKSQGPCEVEDPETQTGSRGSGGSSTIVCWFSIDYDPYSGEVYNVDLLFCTGEGG